MIDLAPIRFLIVEDHGYQRWLTANILEQLGAARIRCAADGRAALEMLADPNGAPEIIISDLDMPEMDGMEFIRHVGEGSHQASLIVASGLDRSVISAAAAAAEAYGVRLLGSIAKPVTAKKLQPLLALHEPRAVKDATPMFQAPEIAEGMRRGEFAAFFQPEVDIESGEVVGAEALARWRHPARGLVSADAFIAPMESAGLLESLTDIVLTSAVQNCRYWRMEGYPMTVSVNLSPSLLADSTISERLTAFVRSRNLEAQHVVFEITESTAATNLGKTLENLARLRMNGFGLSIDDYGTGYSSMQRLARVPFTQLKVDKSFVQNASSSPASRALVESSIDLARKLGISAVAEGVETQAQWNLLRACGCRLAQGHFIARPMEGSDLHHWLQSRPRGERMTRGSS
jgi:EAL domain-containing protein (putative c-di-GMP-specific phosphodiesterase class I)